MGEHTGISWTDHTFNPWIGCAKVGPGCDNCYAENATPSRVHGVSWGTKEGRHHTAPSTWAQPRKWDRRAREAGESRRVFCASLADVFDNQAPQEWRDDLWNLIEDCPNLDWQIVTKRIGNVEKMVPDRWKEKWPENVWLIITVVNQQEADRDIPKLLDLKVRFRIKVVGLSIEPLLGPINLSQIPIPHALEIPWLSPHHEWFDPLHPRQPARIDWVIVGGESGPFARPMNPQWARYIRDMCAHWGVAFFFKQWGEWVSVSEVEGDGPHHTFPDQRTVRRIGKIAAGDRLDGKQHQKFPIERRAVA